MALSKYAGVYKEYLATAFSQATSFRVHFILLIIMDLMFYFSALASVDFIFDHVQMIGPWSRDQFMFFISFMLAVDHLHMTFISEAFWAFSYDVRTGRLDFNLLRPVGTLFSVFFRYIRPATMINIFVPWGCLIWFGNKVELSALAWLSMPFMILFSLALLVAMEILLSMTTFWIIESFGINFLRMQFQQMARWPDFIYKFFARKVFTFFIPILLIGSGPVSFLFDLSNWQLLVLGIFVLVVTVFLIRLFWRLGLQRYESASS